MISLDVGELINKDFVKAVAMTILCMVEIIGCYAYESLSTQNHDLIIMFITLS